MNIGLLDVDGHNFPNLALMKISAYHKTRGDRVGWADMFGEYDIIYKSKIFDFTGDDEYCYNTYEYIEGGSGYDLINILPENIESITALDYSIYNFNYSIQRFSIGCIRECNFCIVPRKEGRIKSDKIYQLNPQGKHIEILDNNFFANPDWQLAIDYLAKMKQRVNFHGIDVRILNEEQCRSLNKLKHHKQIKIAWDNPNENIDEKIKSIIKHIRPYKLMCYVLIGFDSDHEQNMYRINKLKELKIDPFVMAFDKSDPYQKNFARWVNHKAIFKSVGFEEYKKAS